ncbi:MAG: ATP-binding cassette domain-containing protein [Candidatus Eisenbacteria bacterium]|nr:ATP-binding cassette domain-containing protein [Candidatus Eisenbacteria bacterium]
MSAPAPLVVERLARRFGALEAVAELSLRVEAGSIVGFLGANGAGKTTTLRCIAGLLTPDAGSITIAGASLAREPRVAKARMGFVPDRPFLYERLTAREFGYSLGMRQKTSIAAALLHSPPLLLLDEPLNGLDPAATRTLKDLLREHAAAGGGVLVSTHLLDVAERLCDTLVMVRTGRVVAAGTLSELRGADSQRSLESVFMELGATRTDTTGA